MSRLLRVYGLVSVLVFLFHRNMSLISPLNVDKKYGFGKSIMSLLLKIW
ncbi:hypothetical protein [Moraxella lacunata]